MPTRRDFGRRRETRPPRRIILIVCEGTATEALYFRALKSERRLRGVSIEVAPSSRDPLSIVSKARRLNDIGEIDEVWCVFDHEFPPDHRAFSPAVGEAERYGFRLAVSNPSFEFWLLLHFRFTTAPFTSNTDLRDALISEYPAYTKTRKQTYDELLPRQHQAIANAQNVSRDQRLSHPTERFPNPATSVHELIQRLVTLSAP